MCWSAISVEYKCFFQCMLQPMSPSSTFLCHLPRDKYVKYLANRTSWGSDHFPYLIAPEDFNEQMASLAFDSTTNRSCVDFTALEDNVGMKEV